MRTVVLALVWLLAGPAAGRASPVGADWAEVRQTPVGVIFHRAGAESARPASMIVARLAAAPEQVHAVVTDYDRFAAFVPGVREGRVLRRDGSTAWVYQRLKLSPARDRHYVLRIEHSPGPAGCPYEIRWRLADAAWQQRFAATGDAVRPERVSGFWLLCGERARAATEARYGLQLDPGGWLPAWLIRRRLDAYLAEVIAAVQSRLTSARTTK